ncbi:MAG: vitamin B12 dependent-methionine synthase activation domain-containing protein [Acidobacteriota bacterium]
MWQPISKPNFEGLYPGEGHNDEDTPLEYVIEGAVSLALFAVTLGEEISERIADLFVGGELADAFILDQIASFAADHLALVAGEKFRIEDGREELSVLPYSPGYCGWHVSGQRALFARLEPEAIGISLNDSCLMQPIKSVSGFLVLAPIEAHTFSPSFPCCATCTTLACQERIASLQNS